MVLVKKKKINSEYGSIHWPSTFLMTNRWQAKIKTKQRRLERESVVDRAFVFHVADPGSTLSKKCKSVTGRVFIPLISLILGCSYLFQ